MHSPRLRSIDAFRGFAIWNIIFLNHQLPAWLQHAPDGSNRMTYTDLFVPGFLFILGMAVPLALKARRERGEAAWITWRHVLLRGLALVVMGTWMVWGGDGFHEGIGLSVRAWRAWMYLGFFLLWFHYPAPARARGWLRAAGAAILLWLLARYAHHLPDGAQLAPSWWGILGSIGWCYLLACLLSAVSGRHAWLLALVWIAAVPAAYPWVHQQWPWDFDAGFLIDSVVALAGVAVSQRLFLHPPAGEPAGRKVAWLVAAAGLCWAAGRLSAPWFGVSKYASTPAYLLYSLSACLLLYLVFFVVIDVLHRDRWVRPLMPAARLALVGYLLSECAADVMDGWLPLHRWWVQSPAGEVLFAAGFTAVMVLALWGLSRTQIRLEW